MQQHQSPNYENYRALLSAIVLQAVKDSQSEQYCSDAEAFLMSTTFEWLWTELTEDTYGFLSVEEVRSKVTSNEIPCCRNAYH